MLFRLTIACLCLFFSSILGEEAARPTSSIEERVETELIQVEFTAWPKNGDLALCQELTKDAIILRAYGGYPEFTLDRVGFQHEADIESTDTPEQPLGIVLFFDFRTLGSCPTELAIDNARARAFKQADELLQSGAVDTNRGDQVMVVSYSSNGLEYHTDFENDLDLMRDALEELEVSPLISRPQVHDLKFWESLETVTLSLADWTRQAGATAHILYFAGDVKADATTGEKLARLGSRMQHARVQLQSVDLMWDVRQSVIPYGLGTLAWESSGGHLFTNGASANDAVETISKQYRAGCRLLASFKPSARWKQYSALGPISISTTDKRFRIEAPRRFSMPKSAPSEIERTVARVQRPRWGEGIKVSGGLWNIKPTSDGSWVSLVHIRVEPDGKLPDNIRESGLKLNVELRGKKKRRETLCITGEMKKRSKGDCPYAILSKERLDEFIAGTPYSLVLPLTVDRGRTELQIVAITGDYKNGARSDAVYEVPKPPESGESSPWILLDGIARVEGEFIPRPALDGKFDVTPIEFMGYACFKEEGISGTLISDGTVSTSLPVTRLPTYGEKAGDVNECGWYHAQTPADLSAGSHLFKPPQGDGKEGTPTVPFSVTESSVHTVARKP